MTEQEQPKPKTEPIQLSGKAIGTGSGTATLTTRHELSGFAGGTASANAGQKPEA